MRLLLTLALLAVPVAAAAAPNIVAVSVDGEAALAIDTNSVVHPGPPAVLQMAAFTVFGEPRGPAETGYVLAGIYQFECDRTPRLRAVRQILLDTDDHIVARPEEPWTDIDLSAPPNHTTDIYRAACRVEKVRQPEGGHSIDTLRTTYLKLLREGRFK